MKPNNVFVAVLLVVSLLTTNFVWASNSAAIQHEMDHHTEAFPAELAVHIDIHDQHQSDGDMPLDNLTHLCLHLAGHVHPFFNAPKFVVVPTQATQPMVSLAPIFIPESVPDSLLRPPKTPYAI